MQGVGLFWLSTHSTNVTNLCGTVPPVRVWGLGFAPSGVNVTGLLWYYPNITGEKRQTNSNINSTKRQQHQVIFFTASTLAQGLYFLLDPSGRVLWHSGRRLMLLWRNYKSSLQPRGAAVTWSLRPRARKESDVGHISSRGNCPPASLHAERVPAWSGGIWCLVLPPPVGSPRLPAKNVTAPI